MKIEFEKKFILSSSFRPGHVYLTPKPEICTIWQCYSPSSRARAKVTPNKIEYIHEVKESLKIGSHYSINTETEDKLTPAQFKQAFKKSENWCAKVRYTYENMNPYQDVPLNHIVTIDYHIKTSKNMVLESLEDYLDDTFLVLSEVETILDDKTDYVDLKFRLPIALRPFMIKAIDKRDKSSKMFTSANLTPTAENIKAVMEYLNE